MNANTSGFMQIVDHPYTIGFDRFDRLIDLVSSFNTDGFPPYNLIRRSENEHVLEFAVAGFTRDQLSVSQEQNQLTIKGEKDKNDDATTYLHRGLAKRDFRKTFVLTDYVNVTDATLKDGMLSIRLERELPESMQPRQIAIAK